MKNVLNKLVLVLAVAVQCAVGLMVAVAALCDEPRPSAPVEASDVDANGYRCEGDCSEAVACRFCNPRP